MSTQNLPMLNLHIHVGGCIKPREWTDKVDGVDFDFMNIQTEGGGNVGLAFRRGGDRLVFVPAGFRAELVKEDAPNVG